MRYQFKWQDQPISDIPEDSQRNLEATVRRAFEVGINHIETARGYGTSERQLGRVVPRLPRDELIFQTKIGPRETGEQFTREFHDSLKRLNLDYVDLLSIHGINDAKTLDWSVRPGGCFEAAQKLREQGKVRFVGFSTHGPTPVILDAIRWGAPRTGQGFDYVNIHWYFIFQENWAAIEEARRRDMGVFIISPSDKGGKLYQPPERLVELCRPLTPIQFNDWFCLSHPEVCTISVGAARPSDFDEHLKVIDLLRGPPSVLDEIRARLEAQMQSVTGYKSPEYLSHRLPWPEASPAGLNLKKMVWLRQLARGWDLVDYAKGRFNLMGNGGHWFPGAKPSDVLGVDDGELIRAASALEHPEQLPVLLRDALDLLAGEEQRRASQGG